MADGVEYICGTDPNVPGSCFELRPQMVGGQIVVTFLAAAASGAGYDGLTRYYSLEKLTSLVDGDWTPIAGYESITGAGQTVTYTETSPGQTAYYRTRVWLQ